MKRLLIILIGGALLLSAVNFYPSLDRKGAPAPGPKLQPRFSEIKEIPPHEVIVAPERSPGVDVAVPTQEKQREIASAADPKNTPGTQTKTSKAPKPPLKDPLARLALSQVGVSEEAEEYWLAAINDPTIAGEEREDLIEDLNEAGFDDPDNVTADDLPLILSRLQIIETYAPNASEENLPHFKEAYKDLLTMFAQASGF